MLRFEPSQIEAIDREQERQLALHIAELLRQHRRRHVASLSDDDLDAAAIASVRAARNCDLADESDVLLYVTAEIVLRPDFPSELTELFELLTDPAIAYEDRLSAVAAATTDRWR